jgi:hypothetical protein
MNWAHLLSKTLKITFALLLVSAFFPLQEAGANHLTCYASGCNFKDPNSYVCVNDAYTAVAKWASASSGTVRTDLRYSPQCVANWTRTTNESPGQVRRLRAELWNSTKTTLIIPYESSIYVWVYTNMYDGTPVRCARGKQGPVGGGFDAITAYGCG